MTIAIDTDATTPAAFEDRIPPQDLLAERSVLGACLIATRAVDDVLDSGLRGADFYRPAHEAIWEAIRSLHDSREAVDTMTVINELSVRGDLKRVGGHLGVQELTSVPPSTANAGYYAAIVRDRAALRGLVTAGMRVQQFGYATDGGSVDELVNAAQSEVARVSDARHGGRRITLDEVSDAAFAKMSEGVKSTPTPWRDLNHLIDGLGPSMLYATGARPGVGKTVFALQWAFSFAKQCQDDGPQSVYFTFEMSAERLYQRALATASGVDGRRIRRGTLEPAEMAAIREADARMRRMPIVIESASGWTPQQVRARVRQLHRERPVGLVTWDHIGLTRAERPRDNRQAELSEAADIALTTAHDVNAAVHILTQLNRGVTQRSDQRPVPSDIRDTDRIEQNADVVMLLHRDKDKKPDELWVAVAKNRDGSEGAVELAFNGSCARLSDAQWKRSDAE